MRYDLADAGDLAGVGKGPSAYRRTHFRVDDENGLFGGFDNGKPEDFTLDHVLAFVCEQFAGTGGTEFDSKDPVVLPGSRIVAMVLKVVATLDEEDSP